MMSKYVFALALSPALMMAQAPNTETAADQNVTKVIHVRYARAEAVRDLVARGGVTVTANNGLKALVMHGSAANVAATEQAVKELDTPPPNELARDVEVTVYVIGASAQAIPEDRPIADLAPVIRQLKAVFPYGGYQLLDTMMIRSGEGRTSHSNGILKSFPGSQPASGDHAYHIHCTLGDRNDAGSDRTVRFGRFVFDTRVPNYDISIDTNFDIQDGQRVVVGNTTIDGGNSALFAVVSAKFVQ